MATILDGKSLRDKKIKLLKEKAQLLKEKLGLVVIQVGDDPASSIYVNSKKKLAEELGYNFLHQKFPEGTLSFELEEYIDMLNNNDTVDGIIVQMPLPSNMNESEIQNYIDPNKDVDGLTYINQGRLLHGDEGLIPCTPKGIIDLLDEYKIPLEGANVVIVGRSVLVGKPLSVLLTNRNASVTLLHSKSKDIKEYTKNADILISAVGKKHIITKDMVKDGSTVIDVGINRENGKLYGDVDFDAVEPKVNYITPVPGGVGPMTVCELMHNVYEAHNLKEKVYKK